MEYTMEHIVENNRTRRPIVCVPKTGQVPRVSERYIEMCVGGLS